MSADATSTENPTIFGKILAGEIPATRLWEDDECIAFADIQPSAPTHVLVIPRKYIPTLAHAEEADKALLGHMLVVVTKIAEQLGVTEGGYRVVINVGEGGGQSVFHLHMHLLAGRSFSWPPG
jgi:histidine triad (HIT) family protein